MRSKYKDFTKRKPIGMSSKVIQNPTDFKKLERNEWKVEILNESLVNELNATFSKDDVKEKLPPIRMKVPSIRTTMATPMKRDNTTLNIPEELNTETMQVY